MSTVKQAANAYASQPQHRAAKGIEQVGAAGTIDWYTMRLSATGYGAAAPTHGKAQGRILGLRAAVVDARRNLLEVIKGVRIEAETTMANYMTADDRVRTTVRGLVHGAAVERSGVLSDGTYYAVLTMPLTGNLGKTITALPAAPLLRSLTPPELASSKQAAQAKLSPQAAQRIALLENKLAALLTELTALRQQLNGQEERIRTLETSADEQRLTAAPTKTKTASPRISMKQRPSLPTPPPAHGSENTNQEQQTPAEHIPTATVSPKLQAVPDYTGIVIDARGLNFSPSLRPEIYSSPIMGENFRFYPGANVNPTTAAQNGYVRYISSVAEAQRLPQIKGLPLTVKAVRTLPDNTSGLILDETATKTIQELLTRKDNPLDMCKIAIVF